MIEKVEQFIDKKFFNLFFSALFAAFPIIIYILRKKCISYFVLTELFTIAFVIMIIVNSSTFKKKYYIRLFNLTLCSELLFFLESINIFNNSILALIFCLVVYTAISVLWTFLKKY